MANELSPTLEDYLQAIYRIQREQKVVRPKDISTAQNVASSTVTAALQSLADKGLINYQPYELITLTDQGRKRAERLATRHHIVRSFLEDILGLEDREAAATSCEMEHAVNAQALQRFICFLAFIRRYSPAGIELLDSFRQFVQGGADGKTCEQCVKEYMQTLESQSTDG